MTDDRTFDDFTDEQVIESIIEAVKDGEDDIAFSLSMMLGVRSPDAMDELRMALEIADLMLGSDHDR